jgi:hypothetical protein
VFARCQPSKRYPDELNERSVQLVFESNVCVDFAREAGYCLVIPFTNSNLAGPRPFYEATGFEFCGEPPEGSLTTTPWGGVLTGPLK